MKKYISGLCFLLCLSVSIYAQQNARIQSMGNSDIVPDISRTIYYNPAYMNDYKNQAQVSFDSPMIGIASLGNVMSIGAILNRGLILNSSFYTAGLARLPAVTSMEYSPHLLLGVDLTAVKLGADIFWEHSAYSLENSTAATTTKNNQSINHFGFLLGGNFVLSSVKLAVHAGIGFPVIDAKTEATVTTETKSESGFSMRAGAEANAELAKLNWTLGFDWNHLAYQFSVAGTKQNNNSVNVYTPYIGLRTELVDNVLLVAMEKSQLAFVSSKSATDSVVNDTLVHTVSCGLEKQFAKAWIFDSLALRGGLSYAITNTSTDTTRTGSVEIKKGYVTTLGPATPYLGFGVTKSLFTFDLVVDPAVWSGLFSGPDVARATMSVKF
jgi:hypothetical protein